MVRGRANPTLLLQVRAVKGAVFARVNVCKAHQRTESCWMKRRLNGEDLHLASRTSLYQNYALFPCHHHRLMLLCGSHQVLHLHWLVQMWLGSVRD